MVCSRDTCIPKSKYPEMVNTKKVDAMWWVAQMVIYSVYGQCFEGCALEEQNLSACLPVRLLSHSYVALCLKNEVFRITILIILSEDQSFCESLYLLNTARMALSFFAIGLIKHCLFSLRYLHSPSTKKRGWPFRQ